MKLFGIDISRWQGDFNFNKALQEGVKYVIIKAGGADDGLYKDPRFGENYKKAKAAGLGVGAYFFGMADTVDKAKQEAAYFAELLKGKQFDYPVFYDVEGAPQAAAGIATLSEVVRTFCTAMEDYGYWCGFYTNLDWYKHHLNGADLAERFSFWCAAWMSECPCSDAQMWQFGGSVNVIRDNTVAGVVCDQDYCFVDYPTLIKQKGKNGYGKTPTPAPEPKPEPIKKGDKVRMKQGAPVYGTDTPFLPFVYNEILYVRELSGNRAVISTNQYGAITGAVDVKYLYKV